MFKKILTVVLAVSLALCSVASGLAEDFDLSFVRENSDIYSIDVNSENEVAFVEVQAKAKFEHEYSSNVYFSNTEFDVLVRDYFSSNPYPIYRMWINYTGTKHIYATSVTFEFGGKSYTFTDILNSDNIDEYDNGDVYEAMLIIFGNDNLDFLVALEDITNSLIGEDGDFSWVVNGITEDQKIKMTLHGTEDVTVMLDENFYADFWFWKLIMIRCGGLETGMEKANATNMKIATVTE